jgi:hypothetical protein
MIRIGTGACSQWPSCQDPALLYKLTMLVPPSVLMEHGVDVFYTLQDPGRGCH